MGMLRLVRPANIVTAIADILAGVIIAGYPVTATSSFDSLQAVLLLIIATIGLYSGGVVFNDVFDAAIDKIERPERPIPSGVVSKRAATLLALVLFVIAVVAASFVHPERFLSVSVLFAVTIAIAAVVYDKWGKHHSLLGPLNMGLCRGLNLLLGMSIVPASLSQYGWLAIFPIIYIAAITMISRDEVHGGKKITLYGAVWCGLSLFNRIDRYYLFCLYQRAIFIRDRFYCFVHRDDWLAIEQSHQRSCCQKYPAVCKSSGIIRDINGCRMGGCFWICWFGIDHFMSFAGIHLAGKVVCGDIIDMQPMKTALRILIDLFIN
jgi:4-hydroxybenzoate polyprenyltransferase